MHRLPKKIIVVEDEALVALDIEAAVIEAGCEIAGNACNLSEALTLLRSATHDGVILDANLGGESSKPIVDYLEARGAPYIVVSGYSRKQLEFLNDQAVLIMKPFNFRELVEFVRNWMGGNGI